MKLNARALVIATAVGTVFQVAMVVTGHTNISVMKLFAVGGMGISLVAGILYSWVAREGQLGAATVGGILAGGVCAFLGILVSHLLGDVETSLLLLGTLSSCFTGGIGGILGRAIFGGVRAPVQSV